MNNNLAKLRAKRLAELKKNYKPKNITLYNRFLIPINKNEAYFIVERNRPLNNVILSQNSMIYLMVKKQRFRPNRNNKLNWWFKIPWAKKGNNNNLNNMSNIPFLGNTSFGNFAWKNVKVVKHGQNAKKH